MIAKLNQSSRPLRSLPEILIGVVLLIGLSAGQGFGQAPELKVKGSGGSVEVVGRKLKSGLMGREMPYRVAIPRAYKEQRSSLRFPVVYLLHGLTGSYANWFDKTRLAEYARDHDFIVVTLEGGNGWYTDSASVAADKFESYIIQELIPEIDKTYRSIAKRDARIIAGLSMGGYGSIKFGLKYPEKFILVGSFSGALGAASFTEKNIGAIGRSIDSIFGPLDSPVRDSNDLFKRVRGLTPDQQRSLPFIYQSCGTEDFLIQNNRDFLALLNEKKVPHEYREHPGGHDWAFWDRQVREFLDLAARMVKK